MIVHVRQELLTKFYWPPGIIKWPLPLKFKVELLVFMHAIWIQGFGKKSGNVNDKESA